MAVPECGSRVRAYDHTMTRGARPTAAPRVSVFVVPRNPVPVHPLYHRRGRPQLGRAALPPRYRVAGSTRPSMSLL